MQRTVVILLGLTLLVGCGPDQARKMSHFEHDHEVAQHWPADLADAAAKIRDRLGVPVPESTYGHVRDDEDIAFRVMTSQELPVVDALPVVCIPTHVRIKQRRCFEDVRNGVVAWKYEFSKTWSANSRSVVEQLQHMSPPVYEVEKA